LHRIRDDFRPIDENVGLEGVDEEDILSCELSVIAISWNQNPSNNEREYPFVLLRPTSVKDAVIAFGSGIPQTGLVDVQAVCPRKPAMCQNARYPKTSNRGLNFWG